MERHAELKFDGRRTVDRYVANHGRVMQIPLLARVVEWTWDGDLWTWDDVNHLVARDVRVLQRGVYIPGDVTGTALEALLSSIMEKAA